VLLLSDPIDHLMTPELREYKDFQFQSISKGEVDLSKFEDEREKEDLQKSASESKDLLARLKTVLEERVKDVRTTNRLTTSPSCLVVDTYGVDPSLKRLLQSAGQSVPEDKPILEVNPQHPVVVRIKNETDDQLFADSPFLSGTGLTVLGKVTPNTM
jgi:molecular chaperone HtpG